MIAPMFKLFLDSRPAAEHRPGPAPQEQADADPYRDIPLGVECAWPAAVTAVTQRGAAEISRTSTRPTLASRS